MAEQTDESRPQRWEAFRMDRQLVSYSLALLVTGPLMVVAGVLVSCDRRLAWTTAVLVFGVAGAVYDVQRAGRNAHFGWDAATPLPADVRIIPTGTLARGNVVWAMILSGFWSAVAAYAGGRWLAGAGALVFAWGIKGCWNLAHVLI